jgi:hypothetical protein
LDSTEPADYPSFSYPNVVTSDNSVHIRNCDVSNHWNSKEY